MGKFGSKWNIVLVEGTAMPPPDDNQTNYNYQYLSFGDMETYNSKKDPSSSSERIIELMKDKKRFLLWIHNIGTDSDGSIDSLGSNKVTGGDIKMYDSLPSGMVTSKGSIIPQIIIPSESYEGIDNGIYFEDDTGKKHEDKTNLSALGYNWRAFQINQDIEFVDADNPDKAPEKFSNDDHLKPKTYGYRTSGKYITNVDGRSGFIDFPVIETRKYECDLARSECGTGSFALCYSFKETSAQGHGDTPKERDLTAMISLKLEAHDMNDEALVPVKESPSGKDVPASPPPPDKEDSEGIFIGIPPNGQIIAKVGKDREGSGGLSSVQNEIVPPQCRKGDFGSSPTTPLFVYPTYYGLVITNSISSNMKSGGNQVLVPYCSKGDVKNEVRIRGGNKSEEIIKDIKKDKDFELKWFPTIVQETPNPGGISLCVSSSKRLQFGKWLTLTWIKALGNFAYCPIYFHRNLEFTMFFKGVDPNVASPGDKYIIYPIACANMAKGADENSWSGIGSNGANSITIMVHGGGRNGFVCKDSKTGEHIYRADFKFSSDKMIRYPIEVFGVVIVLIREKRYSQGVQNGNGSFDICYGGEGGLILSQFTQASKLQLSESSKKFFSLITSFSIQAGLDGVTGSMTLDGYPLRQGIARVLQDQVIGEIDVDVRSVVNGTVSKKGKDINENNPNPCIFKGYGMEISTNDSAGSYSIGVNLVGTQRKMTDIKIITCPFWDGDRLEAICVYLQSYMKLRIKMLSKKSGLVPQPVDVSTVNMSHGTWKASGKRLISNQMETNEDFRVPRSWDWRSPAVSFQDGTSCFDALKDLGQKCGCIFTVGMDGDGCFYEINRYGFPYYVHNQIEKGTVVVIDPTDIISISMSPELESRYNFVSTIGFLQKKVRNDKGEVSYEQSVEPGRRTTYVPDSPYPWMRAFVTVEKGYFTNRELTRVHQNNVISVSSEIYKGSITVAGNTRINRLYQVVSILGVNYFVVNIDHNIDTSSKSWTTSYQVFYYDPSKFVDNDW